MPAWVDWRGITRLGRGAGRQTPAKLRIFFFFSHHFTFYFILFSIFWLLKCCLTTTKFIIDRDCLRGQ